MRTLETLLLLAELLALCVLSVPRLRALRGWRDFPAIASVVAAAQVLAEGPRWQMTPAYALAALFLSIWLLQRMGPTRAAAAPTRRQPIGAAMAVGSGGLALALAAALPMWAPVFRFPNPAGPYAIGTVTYHWVDISRSDVFAADPKERRQLMVQIWYPAQANAAAPRAAYLPDAHAVTAAFARIHDKPAFIFEHFKYVTTHAMPSAPVAVDEPRYPVLLFLEGTTGFRQMNTFQVEHLVSHGYIVVGEACRLDSRLRACLMMDAPMPTDVVKAGLQQPSMWVTRDAASMRLERQRVGGWPDAEIEAHQATMRAAYVGLVGAGYFVRVPGTFHSNFTDTPNWTPLAPLLGLTGSIRGQRAHDIINAYSLAFFDRHLLGRPAKLLDGTARQYPDALFESRWP